MKFVPLECSFTLVDRSQVVTDHKVGIPVSCYQRKGLVYICKDLPIGTNQMSEAVEDVDLGSIDPGARCTRDEVLEKSCRMFVLLSDRSRCNIAIRHRREAFHSLRVPHVLEVEGR